MKIFKKTFGDINRTPKAKQQPQKLDSKPDEFLSESKRLENYEHETANLEWQVKKIKFFDEDIEKMKTMTHDEIVAYKTKLKSEGRYTYKD